MLPGILFAFIVALHGVFLDIPGDFIQILFIGIVSLCLVASANYVINEYLDAKTDQFHPTKKERVAVKLSLNPLLVAIEYVLLAVVGLSLAYLCGIRFFFASVFLLFMGILYNVRPIRTKDIAYVDVLSESINNAIRLAMGWFLISPDTFPVSSLLFGYWMGGAFLMAVKRYSEYHFIGNSAIASSYRKSFKHYSEKSLLISSIFYGMLSLFFIGVFIIKYRIEYLILVALIDGLFCWYLWLGMGEDSVTQKPEKLYKEWKMFLYIGFIIAVGLLTSFVDIPFLHIFQ